MAIPVVLVVDVDPASRTALAAALSRQGCGVVVAETFADARRLLPELEPAIIVAPVRLGAYNAIHLAHIARARFPHTRTMIIGYNDPVLAGEAAAAGATYLVDPTPADLAATIVAAVRAITRRWPRAEVNLEARVASRPVRLLDVSYGGFRFEASGEGRPALAGRFELDIGGVRVDATPVWSSARENDDDVAWYGAAVMSAPEQAGAWQALVDAALQGHLSN